MTYRRVIEWPDKRLSCTSKPAVFGTDDQAFEDLVDTFRVTGGYGLAAPQIGLQIRAVIINAQQLGTGEEVELLMINPEIIERTGVSLFEEACFSMPQMSLKVSRDHKIKVRWLSRDNELHEREFTGYASACVQHEIDHLDGKLMLDRLSQLRRSMILKKMNKKSRKEAIASKPDKEVLSKRKSASTKKRLRAARKSKKKS